MVQKSSVQYTLTSSNKKQTVKRATTGAQDKNEAAEKTNAILPPSVAHMLRQPEIQRLHALSALVAREAIPFVEG